MLSCHMCGAPTLRWSPASELMARVARCATCCSQVEAQQALNRARFVSDQLRQARQRAQAEGGL